MRTAALVILTTLLVSAPSFSATSDSPEAQLETLLKTLQAKKYDGALERFFAGSMTAQQKPTELRAMGGQVKAAFEFAGPPNSWEIVETVRKGKDLVVLKVISKQKDDIPFFWNATFYRRLGKWEPIGVFFFDDPAKAGFFH